VSAGSLQGKISYEAFGEGQADILSHWIGSTGQQPRSCFLQLTLDDLIVSKAVSLWRNTSCHPWHPLSFSSCNLSHRQLNEATKVSTGMRCLWFAPE